MDKALVLTSYPKKRTVHGKTTVGVASYAKNTLLAIKKNAYKKVGLTVLAEELPDDNGYTHDGIEVKRVWRRDSFLAFPKLLLEILKHHRAEKTLVVEFELAMFGGSIYLLPFPLFLLVIRLLGKKVIFVSHQVVPSVGEIAPHINVERHSMKAQIFNVGLSLFYRSVLLLSNKVIVFEEGLKQKLATYGDAKKIIVIPHGVEHFESTITPASARKRLNIKSNQFVVVSFGYLAWYKGTDWLIHAISEIKNTKKKLSKDITLILAGGPNPNHSDKAYYQRYLRNLTAEAELHGITITGYVPQSDIPLYYKAADVIVFPYRTYMSSSGPLSIAFSFKKPFLLAQTLSGVLHQKDVQETLNQLKINEATLLFKDAGSELADMLTKIKKNAKLRNKLSQLSGELGKKRDWKFVGRSYYEELFV